MLRKIISVVFFVFIFSFSVYGLTENDLSAQSAVIINRQTNEIVFQKNAYEKRSMASTTKIMTAVIACESGRLDETVEVTDKMCGAEGTSIGLKAGYKIKLYDMVYGMMLESGNDAANAVAIFLAGNTENFAALMNEKAKEIGMANTNFVTPSGLDDENHYTTAYDMALLGSYAMSNVTLREICAQKSHKVDFISPDITVTYSNHNRLLSSYDGVYGIKTGVTKKCGRCLVTAAERDGADFIAVTLSAGDDWNDHKKMFDYAFENVTRKDVYLRMPSEISVKGGLAESVKIEAAEYPAVVAQSASGSITQRVYLPSFVYAPVKSGDVLGKVKLYLDGEYIKSVDIIAFQSCESATPTYIEEKSFFKTIKEKISDLFHR